MAENQAAQTAAIRPLKLVDSGTFLAMPVRSIYQGVAKFAIVSGLGPEDRRLESSHPDHLLS